MKLYFIHCQTGCTCCSEEYNHYCGPFSSREKAQERIDSYLEETPPIYKNGRRMNPPHIASQYAPRGRYSIEEHEAEKLNQGKPGRYIIDDEIILDTEEYPIDESYGEISLGGMFQKG